MKNYPNTFISIITVVYNGAKTLEQTIQSVINQTYDNIEYIIIDGGSTDGTLEIIEKYDKHIAKWVSEPDKGLYDAMNKGIRMANGELIGMINSDDWYEIDAVSLIVDAYINNPRKQIFHADRYDVFKNDERKIKKFHPSSFKFKYYCMTYNHPTMFISKNLYQKYLYNTDLKVLSDYLFVLKAFIADSTIFFYINTPIVNYRLDGISGQMELMDALKEGFIARKLAGFNFMQNIISLFIRLFIRLTYGSYRKFWV